MAQQHVYPGPTTPRINRMVMWLVRRGVNVMGTQILAVRGRSSGQLRLTPVNPLVIDGRTYLVAPRGHVQWTRNLRVVGEVELRLGRRRRQFTATEVPDAEKTEILRAYLARWKGEVGKYFAGDGITVNATDEQRQAVAEHYPVFALTERTT